MCKITPCKFGTLESGEDVFLYSLENENNVCVKIMEYGAAIVNIIVPDKGGMPVDIVLGYDSLEGYLKGSVNHGLFVGRFANRIKNAEFKLNGKTYNLEKNDGNNHLHGTWGKKLYKGEIKESEDEARLIFKGVSAPSDEGYPGTVTYRTEYALNNKNELIIEYFAETDEDTVINLTNHSYFNLKGQDGSRILETELTLFCDNFTEGDNETLPTGKILPVEGTPMDFREPSKIMQGFVLSDIESDDNSKGIIKASDYPQVAMCSGYDHNFIINGEEGALRTAARAYHKDTGIVLECDTTQPGIQFYTGNYLIRDKAPFGKCGIRYPQYGGFCLETQHFPASPNYPDFPSTVLKAGDIYHETTVYRFGVKE